MSTYENHYTIIKYNKYNFIMNSVKTTYRHDFRGLSTIHSKYMHISRIILESGFFFKTVLILIFEYVHLDTILPLINELFYFFTVTIHH